MTMVVRLRQHLTLMFNSHASVLMPVTRLLSFVTFDLFNRSQES